MAKSEKTGSKAASNAGRVLRDPDSSPAEKSAAGSALTQISSDGGADEQTGKEAASAAARVLRDRDSSLAAKSAAGSALTQVPDHEK